MVRRSIKIKKRKIAIVTATRAEYGLLYSLMRELQEEDEIELQIIVTGMHLSPEFGLTYRFIEEDGFKISAKVEMLLSSDTAVGTAKSIGLGIIGFTDAFSYLTPDLIILLGDRFESLAVAQAALVLKIPLAHIHGGELSEGAIDDAIRHSITKMAHLHFVASEPYKKRVIQLGEHPNNVYNVGAPGLERIASMSLYNRYDLEKKINFQLGELNFLVTFLPVTLKPNENDKSLQALFEALDYFKNAKIIFTKANADEAGRFVNSKIEKYASHYPDRTAVFTTLGDLNYLSLLQYVDVVIGNSSSGLIEVPYFKKPTVNIGIRQNNRLRASSVIDCSAEFQAIKTAIKKSLSSEFKNSLKNISAPYVQDKTASKITSIIKEINLKEIVIKRFYDI